MRVTVCGKKEVKKINQVEICVKDNMSSETEWGLDCKTSIFSNQFLFGQAWWIRKYWSWDGNTFDGTGSCVSNSSTRHWIQFLKGFNMSLENVAPLSASQLPEFRFVHFVLCSVSWPCFFLTQLHSVVFPCPDGVQYCAIYTSHTPMSATLDQTEA